MSNLQPPLVQRSLFDSKIYNALCQSCLQSPRCEGEAEERVTGEGWAEVGSRGLCQVLSFATLLANGKVLPPCILSL